MIITKFSNFILQKGLVKVHHIFTLQHGNTYFTQDYILSRCEYETSTKFLTFGHSKNSFFEPLGNIKTIEKNINITRKVN